MLNTRQESVLCALVNEYVASVQPVGSKVLVERYQLGCSPATVRSELAALEDTGYVFQPHVSAGRIPTDSGYRVYVDRLPADGEAPLHASELDVIRWRYARPDGEVYDLLRETSVLLSGLTSYVAVVVAPTLRRARIRRVTLVSLAPRRALVVVVTDSGQVANRVVELEREVSAEALAGVEARIGPLLEGAHGQDAEVLLRAAASLGREDTAVAAPVVDAVLDCLMEADVNRVVTGGMSALLSHPEFSEASVARPLVTLLEDGVSLLSMLSGLLRAGDIEVRIGRENTSRALEHASCVAARYGDEDSGGVVGVIGPTRMDYRRAIASVKTVSEALTGALGC